MYLMNTSTQLDFNRLALLRLLDIRTRFLLLPIMLLNIFFLRINNLVHGVFVIALICLLVFFSQLNLFKIIRRIGVFYPMVLLFTLPLLFTNSSHSSGLSLSINEQNIQMFILVQLKYILSLIVLFSITACTSSREFIQALHSFRVPDWILSTLQYISQLFRVLMLEFQRIRLAYQSRSIHTGIRLKLKTIAGLVYVLTVRIIERSERIFLAMLSRGFKGNVFLNGQLSWSIADTLVVLALIALTLMPLIIKGGL